MYEFVGKRNQLYKFNANCKQEEKIGTGPGSCSTNLIDNKKVLTQKTILNVVKDTLNKYYKNININDIRTTKSGKILESIAKIQGFDAYPKIMNNKDFKKENSKVIYRTFDNKQYADNFINGEYRVSSGLSGTGIYVAKTKAIANKYASESSSVILTLKLSSDANIAKIEDIINEQRKMKENIKKSFELSNDEKEKLLFFYKDIGRTAASLGYDALDYDSTSEFIILNRGKLIIKSE